LNSPTCFFGVSKMPDHHHRSGGLRQSNKKNKRTKSSKRSLNKAIGGRVNVSKTSSVRAMQAQSKADRRHRTQQKREASRTSILQKRRGIDGSGTPPRMVGIISLGESQIEERLRDFATKNADCIINKTSSTVTAKYNVHKKDGVLTFLTNSSAFAPHYKSADDQDATVHAALDLCRVCDTILFVINGDELDPKDNMVGMDIGENSSTTSRKTQEWDHLISSRGDRILAAVKAQGLPTPITVLAKNCRRRCRSHDNEKWKECKKISFETSPGLEEICKSVRRG